MSIKDKEWVILDRKTLGTVSLFLETLMAFNISKQNTMKDLTNTLDKLYEKPSTYNKVFLLKQLFNMKMLKDGFDFDHLNEFNMVTNQLSYIKVDFDDEVRALLIFCSLPESQNGLVMLVSN
jgi:hypothetical protein